MDKENASEVDLFPMPSGSHASTFGSPTAHLNNGKMLTNEDADNSNEKDNDKLDALVNEKTTSSILATTQRLFRRACNFANGSKKGLVRGDDCNNIISVRLQINDRKSPGRTQISLIRYGRTDDFSPTRHQC